MSALRALRPLCLLLALPAVLVAAALPTGDAKGGLATITERDLETDLAQLAAPHLEGRDSPSLGLERAAALVEARLRAAGCEGAGRDGTFRQAFVRDFDVPDPRSCSLELRSGDGAELLELGQDFVPLPGCAGEAEGEVVFVGFGIRDKKERFDELKGTRLRGRVAMILEGEPRHRKLFEGPEEVTHAANAYRKLAELEEEGAAGVLLVRRTLEAQVEDRDGEPLAPPGMGYRHSWAHWNPTRGIVAERGLRREWELPVLEVSEAVAGRILGQDVGELARRIEKRGKPLDHEPEDVSVHLSAGFVQEGVRIENVVGVLRGSDPDLADEVVVLGAHYDHIGVDPSGRIGYGADDNASGTAALLELAEALAAAGPRRSVLFCAFAAEEDGLIGSRAFLDAPPFAREKMVAMLNMDMLGRGERREVVVLGTKQNPDLEDVLERAEKLGRTGLKKVITGRAQHLWERSDHYPFHRVGVPVLFFFEAVSELDNVDYHTYRDTLDKLDVEKIANSTRLVFNTAWLLANDDERPSPPR